jgi:anti-anti-sigma factor
MKMATLSIDPSDVGPIVRLRGEIDLSNSDTVRGDLLDAVTRDGEGMILDLRETTYLDSSGVRLLFELAERLHARRQRLVLVVSEEALIRRVVVLTKLDDVVPLVPTIDEATAALQEV